MKQLLPRYVIAAVLLGLTPFAFWGKSETVSAQNPPVASKKSPTTPNVDQLFQTYVDKVRLAEDLGRQEAERIARYFEAKKSVDDCTAEFSRAAKQLDEEIKRAALSENDPVADFATARIARAVYDGTAARLESLTKDYGAVEKLFRDTREERFRAERELHYAMQDLRAVLAGNNYINHPAVEAAVRREQSKFVDSVAVRPNLSPDLKAQIGAFRTALADVERKSAVAQQSQEALRKVVDESIELRQKVNELSEKLLVKPGSASPKSDYVTLRDRGRRLAVLEAERQKLIPGDTDARKALEQSVTTFQSSFKAIVLSSR